MLAKAVVISIHSELRLEFTRAAYVAAIRKFEKENKDVFVGHRMPVTYWLRCFYPHNQVITPFPSLPKDQFLTLFNANRISMSDFTSPAHTKVIFAKNLADQISAHERMVALSQEDMAFRNHCETALGYDHFGLEKNLERLKSFSVGEFVFESRSQVLRPDGTGNADKTVRVFTKNHKSPKPHYVRLDL